MVGDRSDFEDNCDVEDIRNNADEEFAEDRVEDATEDSNDDEEAEDDAAGMDNLNEIDDPITRIADRNTCRRRKQNLKGLEETMKHDNYDKLPDQPDKTFICRLSENDKKNKSYTWKTKFTVSGHRACQDIIRMVPVQLSQQAEEANSPRDLFLNFITT